MIRLIFASVFIAVTLAFCSSEEDQPYNTSSFWFLGISLAEERRAMIEATNAYANGYNRGALAVVAYDNKMIEDTFGPGALSAERKAEYIREHPLPMVKFSKDAIAYRSAMTELYTGHTEFGDLPVWSLVACLADEPEMSCEDLAKELNGMKNGR